MAIQHGESKNSFSRSSDDPKSGVFVLEDVTTLDDLSSTPATKLL